MIEVYYVDGRVERVTAPSPPSSPSRLHFFQEIVGGYVEVLHLGDGRLLLVNEDGKTQAVPLPLNYKATSLVGARLRPGDVIVGTVLVVTPEEFP